MEHIRFEIRDKTGILTLVREEALNALNLKVLAELKAAVDEIKGMKDMRCLVVTGAGGKSFVAGADIGEMYGMDASAGREFSRMGSRLFTDIETLPIPVIAAMRWAEAANLRFAAISALRPKTRYSACLKRGWGYCPDSAEHSGWPGW